MQRLHLHLSVLGILLAGCASTSKTLDAVAAPGTSATEVGAEEKLAGLQRDIVVARARLDLARLERDGFERRLESEIRHAQAEVALARAKEAAFREVDSPSRIASASLDLTVARDRAQEAADELAQIEIMYAEQNLDDLTAEFVVSRGRRNAQRAAERIKIQESAFKALEGRELPLEGQKLSLAVDKASSALDEIERKGELERRGKNIAVQEAENALAKIEQEIVTAREKLEQ